MAHDRDAIVLPRPLAERQLTLTRLPAREKGQRAYSAAGSLYDLVGTPRVPKEHLGLVMYEGPKRQRKRLDFAATGVDQVSCGKEHFLLQRKDESGRTGLYGVGSNFGHQVRKQWRQKPPKGNMDFSRPKRCDFQQRIVDPELYDIARKEKRKRLKREKKLERIRERQASPTNEILSPMSPMSPMSRAEESDSDVEMKSDIDDDESTYPAVGCFASGPNSSAVGYGREVWWTFSRGVWLRVPRRVVQVSVGTSHVLLRCGDRTLYGYGKNNHGQLGTFVDGFPKPDEMRKIEDPEFEAEVENNIFRQEFVAEPVLVARDVSHALASFDRSYCMERSRLWNLDGTFLHFFDEPIESIQCGREHVLVLLKSSRKLYAFGSNDRGALGITSSLKPLGGHYSVPHIVNNSISPFWIKVEKIEEIAAGEHFSALRTASGDVYVWGSVWKADILLRPQKLDFLKKQTVKRIFAGTRYLLILVSEDQDSEIKL